MDMKETAKPRVSVIIPAYNEEALIAECLESMYQQEFQDFEVIVVDDASTDRTAEVLEKVADSRTRVIRHEQNGGPARALLTASEASRGEYIAVIGADERSLPNRLAGQVAFLDKNPDVALVGCQMYAMVDEDNHYSGRVSAYPTTDLELRWQILLTIPFLTTTAMYRSSVIRAHGIDWDLNYPTAQDYKLFSEIMKYGKAANLKIRAGITRERPGISARKSRAQTQNRGDISYGNLRDMGLNRDVDPQDWFYLGLIWMLRYRILPDLEH